MRRGTRRRRREEGDEEKLQLLRLFSEANFHVFDALLRKITCIHHVHRLLIFILYIWMTYLPKCLV